MIQEVIKLYIGYGIYLMAVYFVVKNVNTLKLTLFCVCSGVVWRWTHPKFEINFTPGSPLSLLIKWQAPAWPWSTWTFIDLQFLYSMHLWLHAWGDRFGKAAMVAPSSFVFTDTTENAASNMPHSGTRYINEWREPVFVRIM